MLPWLMTIAMLGGLAHPVPSETPLEALSPSLSFGNVQVGTASEPQESTFTNTTGSSVTLTVAIVGRDAADFAVTADGCSEMQLPDGGSCVIAVAFAPVAEYERRATLRVTDGTVVDRVALRGTGVLPEPAVTWVAARPEYLGWTDSFIGTGGLARSRAGSDEVLHAVISASGTITYRRRSAGTRDASRLSPRSQVAWSGAVAVGGSRVYVVWAGAPQGTPQQTRIYLRSSGADGSAPWRPLVRLTALDGRVDTPSVAASGSSVYVAFTDRITGRIRLQVSHDRGATWQTRSLGSTIRSRHAGAPVVAVAGSTVSVAWLRDDAGRVRFRGSTDGGATWSRARTIGRGADAGRPSIDMRGERTAVVWATGTEIRVRIRDGAGWNSAQAVRPSAGSRRTYKLNWSPAIALHGTASVAVAFSGCWRSCAAPFPDNSDLLWRESTDNGATWSRSQVIRDATGDPGFNEGTVAFQPSIVWTPGGTRYVATLEVIDMELARVPLLIGTATPADGREGD